MNSLDKDIHNELIGELRSEYIRCVAKLRGAQEAYLSALRQHVFQSIADMLSGNTYKENVYDFEVDYDWRSKHELKEPVCNAIIDFSDGSGEVQFYGVSVQKTYPFDATMYYRSKLKSGKWGKHIHDQRCNWVISRAAIRRKS